MNEMALVDEGTGQLLPKWPKLPAGIRRVVYAEGAPELARATLTARGYEVVEINTLPRNTDQENKHFLICKAQGIEEGTIDASKSDRETLELEMRAYGLLDRKTWSLKVNANMTKEDVDELLGWSKSRHTLAGNSTVVSASKLSDAAKKG